MLRNNLGFTLQEVVVVITLMGILSVAAAPQIINLNSDARVATLHGIQDSIAGANNIIYSKAAANGQQRQTNASLAIGSGNTSSQINIGHGYLTADIANLAKVLDANIAGHLDSAITQAKADWIITTNSHSDDTLIIRQNGAPETDCHLVYTQATATSTPKFTLNTKGC